MNGIISACLEVFGLVGNLIAIWILRRPKMQTAFNQLLICTSVLDMVFLLSNAPNTIHALGSEVFKPVSKIAEMISRLSLSASVFMVIALSYERQFAICYPHSYRINLKIVPRWRHLVKYISPVIVFSVVFNLPIILSMEENLKRNPTFIKTNLYLRAVSQKSTYLYKNIKILITIFGFQIHPVTTTGWLPIVLIGIFNFKIIRGIQNLKKPGPYQQLVSVETGKYF